MHNTQLTELLKSFSAYEMNSFGKFVGSSFFNSNKNVIKLYEILERHHPLFIDEHLAKEKVYKKIFPGKKYDDKKIRYLTYDLLKLAEEFLGITNYRKDVFSSSTHSLKELIERKQTNLAYKKIKDAVDILTPQNYPNEVYFYNKHLLKSLSNYLELIQDKKPNSTDVIGEGENIILLAFVVIFQTTFNLFIAGGPYNAEVPSNIIYAFISELNNRKLIEKAKAIPGGNADIMEFYYRLTMLLLDAEDEDNFYKLKSSFNYYAGKINSADLYNLYTALRSYCVQKILHSEERFIKEQSELDKLAIKYDAYSPAKHKYFQLIPFRNFLNGAVSRHEFEWAEELVNNYLHKVDPKYQADLLNYSKAAISFAKKDFEQSLQYTNLIKGTNIFFKYDIKAFTLMIYYELGWVEAALEYIDTYRHFLRRNRSVADFRRNAVLNFVNFIDDMIKQRIGSGKRNPLQIKKKIQDSAVITNKKWLLQKIEELIK